jgi:hypothetical protein
LTSADDVEIPTLGFSRCPTCMVFAPPRACGLRVP